jgi:EmrB/QacA subfamily drug resistance transporter
MKGYFGNRWLVLVAASLGLFLVVVDSTIVNISIPAIIAGLGTDLPHVEWVLNSYTLVFAALLIPAGRLGDMFGRKRIFLIGLAMFGVFSAACGLAPTIELLIAARVLQAVGAAAMMPASLSLVQVSFPPSQRGTAFGIWAAISGFGVGIGPTLGGFLTQYDWRYIFYVNVPLALAAFVFTALVVPESRDVDQHIIDWLGAVLWMSALTAFNYAVIQGPAAYWRGLIPWLFIAAGLLLAGFLWWEGKATEPMMELSLFREPAFSAGNAAMATLLFGMVGSFFLIPLYLQDGLGFSALRTGLALAPIALVLMTIGPIAGNLSDRIEPRLLVGAGMLVVSAALFWVSTVGTAATPASLLAPFIMIGIGAGLAISPTTNLVMRTVPAEYAGAASGMLSTSQRVGAVLGVAVLGAVLQVSLSSALAAGLEGVAGVNPAMAQRIVTTAAASKAGLVGGGAGLEASLPGAGLSPSEQARLTPQLVKVAREAFAQAMAVAMRVASVVVFAAAVLTLLVKPRAAVSAVQGPPV